ncbi:hypothetical protein TWF788_006262 [Orbilia oligospora]|uniref:Uncharacterized protein n=1 Tax=Orbilia oligospora TaxID=2813651 RepID=A0A7C8PWX1_ORBOL|nr:hypothetical protein TWF788_006262 [Orbilia oligospora]
MRLSFDSLFVLFPFELVQREWHGLTGAPSYTGVQFSLQQRMIYYDTFWRGGRIARHKQAKLPAGSSKHSMLRVQAYPSTGGSSPVVSTPNVFLCSVQLHTAAVPCSTSRDVQEQGIRRTYIHTNF